MTHTHKNYQMRQQISVCERERDRRNDLACDLTTSCARIRSRTLELFLLFDMKFLKRGYISYNVKERDFTGFRKKKGWKITKDTSPEGTTTTTRKTSFSLPPPPAILIFRSFVRELEMNLIKKETTTVHTSF